MATLDLDRLLAYRPAEHRDDYDARTTILYALGIGAGLSSDIHELDVLYEHGLKALPTLALVLGTPGFWPMDEELRLDWPLILHGEQSLRLFRPLDPQGTLIGRLRIGDVADKGPGKPALVRAHRTLTTLDGVAVADMTETWVLRGAGGFGGQRDLPDVHFVTIPVATPDDAIALPTGRNQAAIYRLSGDRNPLHIDQATARRGGFDHPILHGLSTMGLVARALIHLCCAGDPARLSSMRVRFTAPVFPGETIRTEVWRQDRTILFRAWAMERKIIVIDGGHATTDAFAAPT